MWMQGAWREIMLVGFEIVDEPTGELDPETADLATRAHDALIEGRAEEAEAALTQALERTPGDSSLLYNLAKAFQFQGREAEHDALVRHIHAQDPDYLFARVALAVEAAHRHDVEAASDLLSPLLARKRLHVSELAVLCQGFIEVHLARRDPNGARAWLAFWEQAAPEHPDLAMWRIRLALQGPLARLRGR
jgi:Flp pilus assembly protein TadD